MQRLCILFLTAALAAPSPVWGADDAPPSNDDCLTCHGGEGVTGAGDRTLAVAAEVFAASVHAPFSCVDCHQDAAEIPHADDLKPVALDTCATCHDDVVAAYREGVHAPAQASREARACGDCHGEIHAVLSHDDPASSAHWSHLAADCARCHANVEVVEGFHIPVVQPVEAYLAGVHGRAVAAGQRAAVCSDCHGAHAILRGTDPRSPIYNGNVPGTCGACHADILAAFQDSVHGTALARGVRAAPVCTECHGEHRILPHLDPDSPVFAGNIPRETCGRCHGDMRLSAKYGIPAGKVSSFQESFHGLALRAGQRSVANCASCHGVHDILPSSDARSSVSAANLPGTCGKCHPGAGTRFAVGPVHVVAATSPTRMEYWVRLVYLWLIALVVGFMIVHNVVDLTVKARRPPPPAPPAPDAPERMPRALRWQHGLVMLSFPVLVYTGFALTYPESGWAAPLLYWESRLGLRGLLHRAAACVLLTALAWHAAQWCASRTLRAALRGLWWSWADLRYFAARLAYYAGRRPTLPPAGTFSYIEKAEYWAFIWGMLVMTGSGLPLWFSDATLRYFPKWATDVATAIHFYEAVLATLAIAVWHLYWVIFDPEVYPMDWSWWDGHAPANRVHERTAAAEEETE